MKNRNHFRNVRQVYCKGCKDHHPVNEVLFINIEEDEFGYDQMTFSCPYDNETYTGTVYEYNYDEE